MEITITIPSTEIFNSMITALKVRLQELRELKVKCENSTPYYPLTVFDLECEINRLRVAISAVEDYKIH